VSSDATLDNADESNSYLNFRNAPLAPGANYVVNASFTTSTMTAAGSYRFIVKADGHNTAHTGGTNTDGGQIAEANEANNTAVVNLVLSRPDFAVSGLTLGVVVSNPNGSFTIPVTYTVTNVGTIAAPAGWYDMGYLSSNATLDNADESNSYLTYRNAALAPGANYVVNASFTTSTTTGAGNYWFIVKADGHNPAHSGGTNTDAGQIAEANEANNAAVVNVALGRPDLAVSGLTLGAVVSNPDGSFTMPVTYTVTNVGTVASPAGWYDIGYVSADATLDNADQSNSYLTYRNATLAPGANYVVNASFTTSTTTAAGTYRFFVKTDAHNQAHTGGTNTDAGSIAESNDANNASSVSVTFVARGTASSTSLSASANPVTAGQATTLTALVTGAYATGTVTFKDAGVDLGTAQLNGGSASLTRVFSTGGSHALTVTYSGDSAYATSTSGVLTLVVNKLTDTVSLRVGINPAYPSQSVPLVATVSGINPTGTVTFRDGATTLGTALLSGGRATFNASFTTTGSHTIVASYEGDGSNTAANSPGVTLQILTGGPLPLSAAPVLNFEYDPQGNRTKLIEAPGVPNFNFTTQTSYDSLDRAKDSTDAKSGVTKIGYDGLDRTLSVTDPRNLVTQYPRNGLGDATSLVSPDTGTAGMTYDALGNLKTRTDSRGVLATHTYDVLSRLVSSVFTQSGQTTLTHGWTYDQTGAGFANGIGRLTSTAYPAGSNQFAYDAQGRVVTDTQRVNAATGANAAQVSKAVGYTYDSAGRVTGIVYPSGRKLTLSVADGEVTGMALAKDTSSAAVNLITNIKWSPFGGPASWQWQMATGTKSHWISYDTSGRMIRYPLGGLYRDLRYDAANRIASYTHVLASDGTAQSSYNQTFGYDELSRLTNISFGTSSWTLGYDANGNRTNVTLNGVSSAYTTAANSNRLNSITNPARSFTYDAAGNTKQDSGKAFTATYDLTGRMTSLVKGGVTTTYAYDNAGRRVRKFSSSGAASTVIFVYGLDGQLLGEYNSAGTALREYLWLGTKPIAMFTPDPANAANPPLVYYIHTDHLDTPRIVSDKNDKRRWRWLAEPFGTSAPETNPDALGVFTQNLRFPGQYADSESGLFYNRNRDYDVSVGRYAQSDPIGLVGGINTYAYVSDNPLSGIDPSGLEWVCTGSPLVQICRYRPDPWVDPDWPPIQPSRPAIPSPSPTTFCELNPFLCALGAYWQWCLKEDAPKTCAEHRTACLDSERQSFPGSVYGSSRCLMCEDRCIRDSGDWPRTVPVTTGGNVRCNY
jgi:RHS repeat-associated protein